MGMYMLRGVCILQGVWIQGVRIRHGVCNNGFALYKDFVCYMGSSILYGIQHPTRNVHASDNVHYTRNLLTARHMDTTKKLRSTRTLHSTRNLHLEGIYTIIVCWPRGPCLGSVNVIGLCGPLSVSRCVSDVTTTNHSPRRPRAPAQCKE